MRYLQKRGPVRAAVIGLGAGVTASFCRPGDFFRFYEINPLALSIASTWFTFLHDCKADHARPARRRAADARSSAGSTVRSYGGGRLFKRRHPRSPAHARGLCALLPPFEALGDSRGTRFESLSRSYSGGSRGMRATLEKRRSTSMMRTKRKTTSPTATGYWLHPIQQFSTTACSSRRVSNRRATGRTCAPGRMITAICSRS